MEDIQDSVEAVLTRGGYEHVAKAYILYRRQREKLRNMKNTYLDYKSLVDSYLDATDWRVKENSTVNYSVGGLILSNSGAITANYWLSEIYDDEIANAHKNADLHLHDLSMLTGYCAGWSLKQLHPGGAGRHPRQDNLLPGQPPLHALQPDGQLPRHHAERVGRRAGLLQLRHLPGPLRQGGQPRLQGGQAVHPELCLRREHPVPLGHAGSVHQHHPRLDRARNDLRDQPAIVGGKEMDFTYGDCKAEMDMVNKAFIDIMIEGDANGRGFQYPIPTYSITKDFDWTPTENNKLLFEMTAKYGTPYFSNYINSDMEPSDVRSMCCRLRLDLRELRQQVRRLLRLRREHRHHRRRHAEHAPPRLPHQGRGRLRPPPRQAHGPRRPQPEGKARRRHQADERGPLSLHPPLPWHLSTTTSPPSASSA